MYCVELPRFDGQFFYSKQNVFVTSELYLRKLAVSVDNIAFLGSMQLSYFGKRPLNKDNSVQSNHTVTLNGQIGYKISKNIRMLLQGFNLLNTHAHAIDYYYTSRLPGERAPLAGLICIFESRSFRVNLVTNY